MFRFTIRDVLWLTVVVGLGEALFISTAEARRQSDGKDEMEVRLIETLVAWAKQKGEPATADMGGYFIHAMPDGTVKLASKVDRTQ